MVDVSAKSSTAREAVARCLVRMSKETVSAFREGRLSKGDALAVARVAGILAAKRTSDLLPLCHPLNITHAQIDLDPVDDPCGIRIVATVRCQGQTGVEMEALTAAAVSGLALIDMGKSLDRGIWVESLELVRKSGGRSGLWQRESG